jgi:phage shock protein C
MFCGACSQQMNPDARFCCHCGRPIQAQAANWAQAGNWNAARLTRPPYGRMIGGVCAGFAEHFGWDVTVVRILTVVLFFCGCGAILLAYIAAWIIMPNAPLFYVTPPPPTGYAGTAGSAPIS